MGVVPLMRCLPLRKGGKSGSGDLLEKKLFKRPGMTFLWVIDGMAEVVVEVPKELEIELGELPVDKSAFVVQAIEERLAEIRLERSKAFRMLLLSVFNRMTEDSKLADEDCLRLGREVNEEVAAKCGLVK